VVKSQPVNTIKSQQQAFVDAAKAAGADEDEKSWKVRLKAVAKPPAKSVKKAK